MTSIGARITVVSLVTGLSVVAATQAQEKKVNREDLPAAVEKTVAEQSQGAAIRGFSTEIENGKRLYEVELTMNGRGKDISMDGNGKIIEVEEEVAIDSLSAEVKAGLTKAAGSGTVTRVEVITKRNRLVAYEAVVKNGTKRSEVQVGPNGEKLAHDQ